jgi:hypothetical protein
MNRRAFMKIAAALSVLVPGFKATAYCRKT